MGTIANTMNLILLTLLVAVAAATFTTKPDGTCGYQCTVDSDCSGCGTAGSCSCPDADTKYPQISCTCVSTPANPPAAPVKNITDSIWPSKWTANVSAWDYGDFSDKTAVASGKFYFDGSTGHTRADWTPFTNGKDATQVWIASLSTADTVASSNYYVKSGPICISFPITDPGLPNKVQVSVERPDWMSFCDQGGWAKYVGREQVDGVWTDHWSCHIDYIGVNQSITFQNWHSLGLDTVPKGLPVRVTGGNSAPNPTQGSPRLNSVWYSNFKTGDDSVKPDDFKKPAWICIPVMMDAAEQKEFFGFVPTHKHVMSADFHQRAHWAVHANSSAADLHRASSKPVHLKGANFKDAMQLLNSRLTDAPLLQTKACSTFTLAELEQVQRLLLEARSPALQRVYEDNSDTRALRVQLTELAQQYTLLQQITTARPELFAKVRDGLCHETVMLYVHHLSEGAREEVQHLVSLPLMPPTQHAAKAEDDAIAAQVHSTYNTQVSCAVCHVQ